MFMQENAFENVVWKMVAILSRPQWVTNGASMHQHVLNHVNSSSFESKYKFTQDLLKSTYIYIYIYIYIYQVWTELSGYFTDSGRKPLKNGHMTWRTR